MINFRSGKVPGGGSNQGGKNVPLTQNRARIRARLNFEDQINDKVKVVVGIATDGGNLPCSNNVILLAVVRPASKDGVTNLDTFGKPVRCGS